MSNGQPTFNRHEVGIAASIAEAEFHHACTTYRSTLAQFDPQERAIHPTCTAARDLCRQLGNLFYDIRDRAYHIIPDPPVVDESTKGGSR
jgi:hypothetical protein